MNQKGQIGTLGIAIVVGIMLFMVGMMAMNFIKDEVTRARDSSSLNCASSDISNGTKLTCLAVDIVVPYLIVTIFAAAGGLIVAKFVI